MLSTWPHLRGRLVFPRRNIHFEQPATSAPESQPSAARGGIPWPIDRGWTPTAPRGPPCAGAHPRPQV